MYLDDQILINIAENFVMWLCAMECKYDIPRDVIQEIIANILQGRESR